MDAFDITQDFINRGEAWHVGIGPAASQYIFTTKDEANRMCAHLNNFPGCEASNRVRTQLEINAYKEAAKAAR